MSRVIYLTQGKYALVDDENYDYLNQWKWFAHQDNKSKEWYAQRNEQLKKGRKIVGMHTYIINSKKGNEVDHINRNGLYNIKDNLREVTHRENCQNRRKKGMFPLGVSWAKDKRHTLGGSFNLQIKIGDKKFSKYFIDPLSGNILYKFICDELKVEGI